MEIGNVENLTIVEMVDFGAYLSDETKEKVLLPKKQVPNGAKVGDTLSVFIYKDSKDRIISTRKMPFIKCGEIGELYVKDVNEVGAFLNMGLERDLFLPFSEQTKRVKVGDKVKVLMYVDKSNRLCATTFINNKAGKEVASSDLKEKEYIYNAEVVYKKMKEKFKGHLIYNDKQATSEQILRDFDMSKNTFKKAIGKLLKDDKIKITDKGIFVY